MEQRKLPFVWEIKYPKTGVVSHAVGTIHFIPYDKVACYEDDARKILIGKQKAFFETTNSIGDSYASVRDQSSIDDLLAHMAHQQHIPLQCLETQQEIEEFLARRPRYRHLLPVLLDSILKIYPTGNETLLTSLVKTDEKLRPGMYDHSKQVRNPIMVLRSISSLQDTPCLVATGIAHYLLEPSMLDFYKSAGFEVRRI